MITDFVGVGKGSNPSSAVIASFDTLEFGAGGLTAQNLQFTQNGNNLEITFEDFASSKVTLQNFKLENLNNLPATSSQPAINNIVLAGQTNSFNIFDANSTQTSLLKRNTVTFLNDLDNNITGFDNSNDVINGQGGDDTIDGKSGNDLLRGGAGNDILIGGVGNDTLIVRAGNDIIDGGSGNDSLNGSGSTGYNLLNGDDGNDSLDISGSNYFSYSFPQDSRSSTYDSRSLGNNTLNGGAGSDRLSAGGSKGDNLLNGDDGNDFLDISGNSLIFNREYNYPNSYSSFSSYSFSLGNNTLNGGAGNDSLSASGSTGNNLLNGGDGNDSLDISGYLYSNRGFGSYEYEDSRSLGNNTLNGGAGNDRLNASGSTSDNLLDGGDGNDSFYVSTPSLDYSYPYPDNLSDLVTQTVDGGKGNDLLSVDYTNDSKGITSTFNATTKIGSITGGTINVSYKSIERFQITGTAYDDNIVGGNGNDTLSGGTSGNDTIFGGAGNDLLIGGSGNDTLYGGDGTDTFSYYGYNQDVDTIYDFNPTNEVIQVSASFFGSGLSIGSLQTSQFAIGTSATTSAQRFIYDLITGGLYFDQDGSASGFTQVKFAQLSAGLSLTKNNYKVV